MPAVGERSVGFFGMVAATMALLRFKERWDDCASPTPAAFVAQRD